MMLWQQRPLFSPEGEGGAAGSSAPAAAAPAAGAAGTPGGAGGAPPAWHANIAPEIKDFWAAKKYDLSDPAKLVDVVTRGYQNAEKFMGVPQEEIVRLPKPNADTNEINTFWNRIGVPKEAKDYDFANLKMPDGSDIDPALSDTMRASLHANRVPKEFAPNVLRDVTKYLDNIEKSVKATQAAEVQQQTEWLKTNWGNRAAYNLTVARDAMDRFGQAAGLTKEQIDQGFDALSKVGGIGSSFVLEMMRQIGSRMGEDVFRSGGQLPGADRGAMSREDARVQIDALKRDQGFAKRLLEGDVAARRQWDNLHKVLTGVMTTAA